MQGPSLPIDELLGEITGSLERNPNLLLVAEPGAGKTTRVPRALLEAARGQVLVLEPRRMAARMAARRVAWEMGEEPGKTVGYQVRFEHVASAETRLHFLTEGVLVRRMLTDPDLEGVEVVVLDEFHERHIETDLALALLRRLQRRRPELKLVVMSATLEAGPIAEFLGGCPVLRSAGRAFPLTIEHRPYSPERLEDQVREAVEGLIGSGEKGGILVFLPGAVEIRRALRACEPVARRAERLALPLYGDLPAAEQDRAVAPSEAAKIVFATNVAESSVTIAGVTAVVDSGLERQASWSRWTGLPTLEVGRVSQASATQRAGRAGRTAPGRVVRLYTQQDFLQRPEQRVPEIVRGDLAELCLLLRALGIEAAREMEWLEAPPEENVAQAERLLDALGATGRAAEGLMRLPVHPRLARMILSARGRGVGRAACLTAALLESGARRRQCDLLEALEEPLEERTRQSLRSLLRVAKSGPEAKRTGRESDQALCRSILEGFPDRVARRRTGTQAVLSNGVAVELAEELREEFLIALEVEDRTEKTQPVVRLAAPIEPEWLLDAFPEQVREENRLEWNRAAERVEAVSRLLYEELVLDESKAQAPEEAAAALLAEKALEAGIERFVDGERLEEWLARLEFAGKAEPDLKEIFPEFCAGMRSFGELRTAGAGFLSWLEQRLGAQGLHALAPEAIQLPSGRRTRIRYERGKPPWIASYLQDFFGWTETPAIGPKRTPLVLHLLAPNRRPVQMTTDLAGFWERLYPQLRRELGRRYPRHKWPERPNGSS